MTDYGLLSPAAEALSESMIYILVSLLGAMLGWILVVSGAGKAVDVKRFEAVIGEYRLTDRKEIIKFASRAIPFLEICIGMWLVVGGTKAPLLVSFVLFSVFVVLQVLIPYHFDMTKGGETWAAS